ncbi:hypothetical protein GOP47_0001164 [Adiantum capillus-veneris]|uniref:Uncharacterized protein n=2 Tax=Adiantum capillus-veneris TaxID=13818 RepID=A0A9D4VFA9_ADICA|nr:hypothetical protein GOP47_0001164 [Adiantum capillus-veneris]
MAQRPGVLLLQPCVDSMLPSLERSFTVFKLWEAPDEGAFVAAHAPSIRGLVGNTVVGASASLIDALPHLEIVSSFSVGLDKIDLPRCRQRGIAVTYTPDVLTDCTADTALSLMLACLRRIPAADRFVRQRLWPVEKNFIHTTKASGKRVGIVGLGRIGMAIAKRVEAFGCPIAYQGRSAKSGIPYSYYSTATELAANSDVLMIACPLTEGTKGSINREVLDALGPSGFLINIARGPIVDEAELVKALVEGRIGGAGLDVFENEPQVPQELTSLDNVVLTPHVGSLTWETRRAMADLVVSNLEAYFAGKPLLTPV